MHLKTLELCALRPPRPPRPPLSLSLSPPPLSAALTTRCARSYELIFVRIGGTALAKDLSLYSLGIFSLFAHAEGDTVTRRALQLLERFYLPLGVQLGAAVSGLLPALLPLLPAAAHLAAALGDVSGAVATPRARQGALKTLPQHERVAQLRALPPHEHAPPP